MSPAAHALDIKGLHRLELRGAGDLVEDDLVEGDVRGTVVVVLFYETHVGGPLVSNHFVACKASNRDDHDFFNYNDKTL